MAARPEFTIADWRKTQFIRRDAARVEADAAALRAAGLPRRLRILHPGGPRSPSPMTA